MPKPLGWFTFHATPTSPRPLPPGSCMGAHSTGRHVPPLPCCPHENAWQSLTPSAGLGLWGAPHEGPSLLHTSYSAICLMDMSACANHPKCFLQLEPVRL